MLALLRLVSAQDVMSGLRRHAARESRELRDRAAPPSPLCYHSYAHGATSQVCEQRCSACSRAHPTARLHSSYSQRQYGQEARHEPSVVNYGCRAAHKDCEGQETPDPQPLKHLPLIVLACICP